MTTQDIPAPAGLTPAEVEIWNRAVRHVRLPDPEDRRALARVCRALAAGRHAEAHDLLFGELGCHSIQRQRIVFGDSAEIEAAITMLCRWKHFADRAERRQIERKLAGLGLRVCDEGADLLPIGKSAR
jgi:hypothetical protein